MTKKQPAPKAQPEQTPEGATLFHQTSWKGVITVYMCNTCNHCENERDTMVMHVLTHLPEGKREKALDQLLKE